MDVLQILQQWDPEVTQGLITALNGNGITSDEDETGLSSNMVENWTSSCETFLRAKGYGGGQIERCGNFFNSHGAVYALYDSKIISYEDAMNYLILVSKRVTPGH